MSSIPVTVESIRVPIAAMLRVEHLLVSGDGTHFEALVVSDEFAGKNRVQRHQMVYRTLGERMRGEIHALSIKAYTPQEWESMTSDGMPADRGDIPKTK